MQYKTISAISTPRGKGGISVIRISGDHALEIAKHLFIPKNKKQTFFPPRYAIYGSILSAEDKPIDEGILTYYKAPNSFTGEDMVEISCHGGVSVTEEVYLSTLAHGASSAGAGEFTKRAFLNGKLSLTEAEAVGQLIDADTSEKVKLASGALSGNISREIRGISDSLLTTMTALYAAIDYPEEDVGDEGEQTIADTLTSSLRRVNKLLSTYKTGRAVSEGVKTTICGKPNVGKSSVFNLIVGDDAAIVTDIAGTTRDVLRENVSFAGITLRLSDTAGVREADDTVEKFGINKAEKEIISAELILSVFDSSRPLDDEDKKIIEITNNSAAAKIALINKTDLGNYLPEIETELKKHYPHIIPFSAQNGEGKETLEKIIETIYGRGEIDLSNDAVIWDIRHKEILTHTKTSLEKAIECIKTSAPLDVTCTLTEEAMAYLNESDGRSVGEEIVNEVFKRFCVGK